MAYDLSSGCKSVWDCRKFTDPKSELSDCFFLGPPLAVNGKLYVLAEKQQELRLICLENVKGDAPRTWKPKIDFVLPLGISRDSQLETTRSAASTPPTSPTARACWSARPTSATSSASTCCRTACCGPTPTATRPTPPPSTRPPAMGRHRRLAAAASSSARTASRSSRRCRSRAGRSSAPIIQDGKVVFTAPDSKSIHCVNLRTARPSGASRARRATSTWAASSTAR